jgi:hypothetical protein
MTAEDPLAVLQSSLEFGDGTRTMCLSAAARACLVLVCVDALDVHDGNGLLEALD